RQRPRAGHRRPGRRCPDERGPPGPILEGGRRVTSPTAAPETLGGPPRVTVGVPGGARVAVFDHPAPEPAPGTPTVVLAHGWCLTHETWDPVVTELQHRRPDVRVLTYDQPGHGLSTSPDSRRAEITDLGRTL